MKDLKEKYCSHCGKKGGFSVRDAKAHGEDEAFLEFGRYDEQRNEYEFEQEVKILICDHCQKQTVSLD